MGFEPTHLRSIDASLDIVMKEAIESTRHFSPRLAGMISYHMGWVDQQFAPLVSGSIDQGKRIRPRLATLTCRAMGGDDRQGLHLAAAIELLHNFTLVHDDIQDRSDLRRHRRTVWSIWGDAQAINVGDAMYAASKLALLGMRQTGVPDDRLLEIARAFEEVAIEIVAGQVTDLEFEGGRFATVDDYLRMIGMKTAAIVRFAAWAGAIAGGTSDADARAFGHFGESIGLGFQIRDDILGIWGASEQTGKPRADDIRRRKQSLPIIELRAVAPRAAVETLNRIYGATAIDETDVKQVLGLLDSFHIKSLSEARVRHYHDEANTALQQLQSRAAPAAIEELRSFVKTLELRTY